MTHPLHTVADQLAITEIIHRLFVGTDNRDWTGVRSCLAPRVMMDMSSVGAGPASQMTPEQITGMWKAALESIQAVHHQVGNHLIAVDEDRASASCYGIATHYLPNPSGRNLRSFVGSYDFELEKAGGRWTITMMRFNLKYIDGNLDLETS